jgi:diaminohydroxyphosphoribosylaminopyrimidine deaminase/5-amino-6-(5-phosphoribosylamino)uracil reductase
MVGCIIVDESGRAVGSGYHARCGGPHAEVAALAAAGPAARGSTLYVSLEPCTHHGRTPPCVDAITEAAPARVCFGCPDPHPAAGGGAETLRARGIEATHVPSESCRLVSAPFTRLLRTGLPWVTAKWAQTIDGRIATRSGDSKWISGARSRRLVHRERGRVDGVLTGIGTVRTDDPLLTARGVRRRRTAARLVIDPHAALDLDSALIRSIDEAPVIVVVSPGADRRDVDALRSRGVDVVEGPTCGPRIDLTGTLTLLARTRGMHSILVEAGPGLLTGLFDEGLICEAAVFVAPRLIGDPQAIPPLTGRAPARIESADTLHLRSVHHRGDDVLLRYGVSGAAGSSD